MGFFKRLVDEYVIKVEEVDPSENGTAETFYMTSVYTKEGFYVGDLDTAQMLLAKYNLTNLQTKTKDSVTCTVGFNIREQKWYGWSHRAIYGFGIGSEVKKGDCAYQPANKEDFIQNQIEFWSDTYTNCTASNITEEGFELVEQYNNEVPNENLRNTEVRKYIEFPETCWIKERKAELNHDNHRFAHDAANNKPVLDSWHSSDPINHTLTFMPDFYGKGEWTAKTLEDAKQMAIDFAEGVN